MPYQNLTGEIPDSVIASVTAHLNGIKADLVPHVVNLSMAERSNLYKMGPTRYSLAQKVITVCDTMPQVVPPFVIVVDIKDDFKNYDKLAPVLASVLQIAESLSDTMMAHGSEVMTKGAKPIYASLKVAKDQAVPGADSGFDLLNPYYDLPDQPDGGNP